MLLKFVILFCGFVACLAMPQQGTAPSPSPTPQAPGVYCGVTPDKTSLCLGSPVFFKNEVSGKCSLNLSECDRMKCLFRVAGFSSSADDKVNKQKVAEHFDQYAIEHPMWSPAVQHLKVACLEKDLPAQGPHLDCAAFDIMHCSITSFIKNASPSQWAARPDCVEPRSYAASCPVCPSSCFFRQVPSGTCNACLSLPRSQPYPVFLH